MMKIRVYAFLLLLAGILVGCFAFGSEIWTNSWLAKFPFKLGLDLNGGTHLVYKADTTKVLPADIPGAMNSLRDVIERRVNLFGVSEPLVQVEEGGAFGGPVENRLIVELPGVTEIEKAVALIGQTPLLEFKLQKDLKGLSQEELQKKKLDEVFTPTELTGQYLQRAELEFDQRTGEPKVVLVFNGQGSDIFAKITRENVEKVLAIFLDGAPISTPVIRQEITGGRAEISGNFTPKEAQTLVRNLNYGALPVPIALVKTQTIGASLGERALTAGVNAGLYAFIIVALFLIVWYRLPGFIAVLALSVYVFLNLALFKLIPVTLTAAGIAGFILSIGMAVDANILIFERMKEELKRGKNLEQAVSEGFARAWLSIRDSNLSSMITAFILFWFASSSVIKGFALVFGLGVLTSMFTAITLSRTLLKAIGFGNRARSSLKFFWSSGFDSGTPSDRATS